jgi:hypothetical protein
MLDDNSPPPKKSNAELEMPAELELDVFIKYIEETDHVYSTAQIGLCFAVIARIYRRVLKQHYFGDIKVDGNMIVDGNHRYIAYKLANIEFDTVPWTRSFCDEAKKFNGIKMDVKNDWDKEHPVNKVYCDDDFLAKGKYLRVKK